MNSHHHHHHHHHHHRHEHHHHRVSYIHRLHAADCEEIKARMISGRARLNESIVALHIAIMPNGFGFLGFRLGGPHDDGPTGHAGSCHENHHLNMSYSCEFLVAEATNLMLRQRQLLTKIAAAPHTRLLPSHTSKM